MTNTTIETVQDSVVAAQEEIVETEPANVEEGNKSDSSVTGRLKERTPQICKSKIILNIAKDLNMKAQQVKSVVDNLFEMVVHEVSQGRKVAIDEFGSWCAQERKERNGVNPKTQERILIPKKRVATFTPSKHFKFAVAFAPEDDPHPEVDDDAAEEVAEDVEPEPETASDEQKAQ